MPIDVLWNSDIDYVFNDFFKIFHWWAPWASTHLKGAAITHLEVEP